MGLFGVWLETKSPRLCYAGAFAHQERAVYLTRVMGTAISKDSDSESEPRSYNSANLRYELGGPWPAQPGTSMTERQALRLDESTSQ